VEAISGCDLKDSIFLVLASLVPPGSPYDLNEFNMEKAFVIAEPDWDSTTDFYKFEDETNAMVNIPLQLSSILLFDIK
jgi:hypothetical protein